MPTRSASCARAAAGSTRAGWGCRAVTAWTARDLLPPGRLGDLAVRLPGERYLRLAPHLRGADIVHSQELGYWYSDQAARLRESLGFRLVLTVWETLPFLDAYRNVRTRPYRRRVLAATDLFLAASERARDALLLEGAPRGADPGLPTGGRRRALLRRRIGPPGRPADDPRPGEARLGEGPPGHPAGARAAAPQRRRGRGLPGAARDRRPRPRGRAAARPRRRAGPGRAGRVPRFHPLRGDAGRIRGRSVPGSCQPADDLLGGAVRHGPRRGDGGRGADHRVMRRGRSPR